VDDVLFSHNGVSGQESKTTLCFVQFTRRRHRDEVAVNATVGLSDFADGSVARREHIDRTARPFVRIVPRELSDHGIAGF